MLRMCAPGSVTLQRERALKHENDGLAGSRVAGRTGGGGGGRITAVSDVLRIAEYRGKPR